MEVIIPVIKKQTRGVVVADGFHATDTLCLFNPDTNTCKYVDVSELTQFSGNLVDELRRRGVDSVITSQMSFMAYGLFIDSGFIIYQSASDDLLENIEMFKKRELDLFAPQMAFKKSCGSSCQSCDAICKN